MPTSKSVTLFVPALNELEGMKALLPLVPRDLFSQILIVDGGSTDGSVQWARSQGFEVYIQQRRGLRNAYIEAWPLIRGEYVLTFSPDGNCRVEDMAKLIEKIGEGFDMVIGSRYGGGAKSEDDGAITGFGNWMFTRLINLLHGGKYTDALTIFRIYRTSMFKELGMNLEKSYWVEKAYFTVIGIEPLLSVRAARRGKKIGEIPSDEPKRISGHRKLQVIRWGAAYLTQVLAECASPRG